MELQERYNKALTFEQFVDGARKNQDLWRGVYRLAKVPQEYVERVKAVIPGQWHLLVLAEDWCGDAVNSVPLIVRLAEASGNVDVRLLARDKNPDIMDQHLTNGSRSIPVVMVLDEAFEERGSWGPRPHPLQEWMLSTGLQMPSEPRYHEARTWYARDRGLTTLEEVVGLLESAAAVRT
jgi:hypothetical protein